MIQANRIHWFTRHTVMTALAVLLLGAAIVFIYVTFFKSKEPTHYGLALVKRGTIISSVTGTGHISASNQLDIKSTVSGTIIGIDIASGQHVEEGTVVMRLDDTDAAKTVRDANVGLQSAKLALKKLQQPPDRLSVLQAQHAVTQSRNAKQRAAEDLDSARIALQKMTKSPDELAVLQANNALTSAQEALRKAEDNLKKSREDGFNSVADAFLNFPAIMTGLNDMFYVSSIDRNQLNTDWYANQITRWDSDKVVRYKGDLAATYALARDQYAANFDHYKTSSRSSDAQTLESLIIETYETSKRISDTVKAANNYIDLIQNVLKEHSYPIPSAITTHKGSLTTYTNQSNMSSSDLLAIKQSIEDTKTSIVSAQRLIDDKTESLRKLNEGADPLDIQSQELAVMQREHALADAQEQLKEYVIHAPFGGDIAALPVKIDDSLSPSNVAATLITRQRIAELSLSEVDVAHVKRTQKVTLSFDAIPDMTISGTVSDIDVVGTVSQGVVTYVVKVSFDTQDERVKPGMSASGTIITDVKQDILTVPNAAVKTRGDAWYVSMPTESISGEGAALNDVVLTAPVREVPVTVGSVNDTLTEIVSGLNEGDIIIAKTIQQQTKPVQSQTPSLFGSPGGNRGFGGSPAGGAGRPGR